MCVDPHDHDTGAFARALRSPGHRPHWTTDQRL